MAKTRHISELFRPNPEKLENFRANSWIPLYGKMFPESCLV